MKTIRFSDEVSALTAEAEQRARAGEKFSSIARELGVPASTLSGWARAGGWSRAQLEQERAIELTEMYARLRTANQPPRLETRRLETKSSEQPDGPASEEASTGSAPDDAAFEPEPPAEERLLPEFMAITMAEMLLERGQFDAAEKLARLATRFYDFRSKALYMSRK
jgi:transposase-like protein